MDLTGVGDTLTAALYAEDQGSGANNYAIYSAGGKSYFGGNVGIGTTAPSTTLQVAGASSTIKIGGTTACIEMANSNGSAGINDVTFLNGVMTATTTKPSACQ